MATYEQVVRETDRFAAVDLRGQTWMVVETTTFKIRVGFIAKPHEPIEVGKAYALQDGEMLLPQGSNEFQTRDGQLFTRASGG